MKQLSRYDLQFTETYKYFYKSLSKANEISKHLISLVDFKSGHFFTILDENIEEKKLYEFKYGGISSNRETETQNLIYNIISSDDKASLWFDDYNQKLREGYDEAIFLEYGMYYEKEIYYQMTKETVTKENLETCFNYSNTFWHSLCFISKTKISSENKQLSIEHIKQICLNAQLILICAYDADAYVFWERSNEYHPFIQDLIS